ncbi:MAG: 3-dehydroquinate synthase [Gemmataceae bacterium]
MTQRVDGVDHALATSVDNIHCMLHVNLGPRSYDISVVSANLTSFGSFARDRSSAKRGLIIADDNVMKHAEPIAHALHSVGIEPTLTSVSPGEASKALAVAARLYDVLASLPADRKTPVIAVGGGVVGDLAGFVAATYNRGLPFFQVPTTLLAMVDSSVGGKVGINISAGKNLVGAFHQPAGVWIDTATLATLPDREYRSGLAEVVKYGVILDADFFAWLEDAVDAILLRTAASVGHIVRRSCELKTGVVEQDEREETGLRAMLNYGHTFAHAFEAVGGYGTWLHGEAVAAGMVCASRLAEKLGRVGPEVTTRQIRLLERFGLPTVPLPEWDASAIVEAMRRDKKSVAGSLRLVLPTRIGHVEAGVEVDEGLVRSVVTEF